MKIASRLGLLNGRESSNVFNVSKRWKATAAPASAAIDIEVDQAKSYNEIPGARSLPFIGTAWTVLPVIGMQILNAHILFGNGKLCNGN